MIYEVIAGHENAYVNNSSQNRGRAMDEVAKCLYCQDASTDKQYDLPGPFIRSGYLTWHKFIFSNWPIVLKMHMVRFLLTRVMRWCLVFYSIFLVEELLAKTLFISKSSNVLFGIPWEGKMWPKVVKLDTVRFGTSQTLISPLLRSAFLIRDQMSSGRQPLIT